MSSFHCITKVFFPALLLVLIISLAASQNSFCDEIGPDSECIQKSDRQLDQDRYRFSYIFQMETSSVFESQGGQPNFQIFNLTFISGTWRGSFNISSNETKIKSGAKFRPENGNIVIGTKLPEGDIEFPSSSLPTGCQDVKYRNQSASSGVYEIDPDGEGGVSPFNVYCEINSNGGWIKVRLDDDGYDANSDNMLWFSKYDTVADQRDTHGSIGEQFDWSQLDQLSSEDDLDPEFSPNYEELTNRGDGPEPQTNKPLRYEMAAAEDTDYNESQIEALRADINDISPSTRMFTHTNDDDNCDPNGEVYIRLSSGGTREHVTPYTSGNQVTYSRYWDESDFSNHEYLLPTYIDYGDYDTAGCSGTIDHMSWGYEKDYTLVRDLAKSCQEIKNRAPEASSGTYRIDPDGVGGVAPFKVYCEMEQDGGGWMKLRISNHESDRVVTNDHGGSYGFDENCGSYDGQDDKYYRGTDDLSWTKSTSTGTFIYDVDYSSGGNSLSEAQEQALRDIASNISENTRSVSLTCDDDGHSKSGHEVTLTDGSGDKFTTTSQTDVSGSGFIGFWVHSTDKAENTFDAIETTFTGSGPANRSLPPDFIIPAEMTADINSGGAVAWGYEQDYVLMK